MNIPYDVAAEVHAALLYALKNDAFYGTETSRRLKEAAVKMGYVMYIGGFGRTFSRMTTEEKQVLIDRLDDWERFVTATKEK
jgi:hypothetical protein